MKKKILAWIVTIGIFILPFVVHAETVTTYDELKTAGLAGGEITLGDSIELSGNITLKNAELDINGKEINTNGNTLIIYGDTTVKDTGTTGRIYNGADDFSQIFQVGGSETGNFVLASGKIEGQLIAYSYKGKFTINGGTLNTTGYAIYNATDSVVEMNGGEINNTGDYQAVNLIGGKMTMNDGKIKSTSFGIVGFKDTEITINGGTIEATSSAISGNGSETGSNAGVNAKFTINGGTLTSSEALAIYAPQINGVTKITGGTLTGGESALEIRAGSLEITGGTFTGNTEKYEMEPNGNGSTTIGAAISIKQHTTKKPINVKISGGTFNAYLPLSEANPEGNTQEDLSQITIDVTGGTFNSTNGETVVSEDFTGIISGGKYTHHVTQYLKDGYTEVEEDGMIAVYPVRTVTIEETENGTVKTSITEGVAGSEVELTLTPDEKYILLNVKVLDEDGNEVQVNNNKFIIPDSNVTIKAQFIKVTVEEVSSDNEVEEVTVGIIDKEKVQEVLVDALNNDETLAEAVSNTEPAVEVVIKKQQLDEETLETLLEQIKSDEATILEFYDISIVVKDKEGNEIGKIEELPQEIEIAILIPENIAEVEAGYKRTYYIIREHNGVYTIINPTLSEDGKTLTFKTDEFSSYGIAYQDEPTIQNRETSTVPETYDNIMKYVIMMIASLGMLGIFGLILRKKKTNK